MFKIVSTIGPISEKNIILKKIINNSDLIRLNGAHNSLDWHKKLIKKIRKINPNVIILLDLPGIKPRTTNKHEINIKKNQLIKLIYNSKNQSKNTHNIYLSNPLPEVINDKKFTISDGNFNFIIKSLIMLIKLH